MTGLGIELYSLKDIKQPIPKVNETGTIPLENARLKAETYYKAFDVPVFSCDSGLYIGNLPEDLQPEIHVRRISGRNLTDNEMLEYYYNIPDYNSDDIGSENGFRQFFTNIFSNGPKRT